MKILLEELAHQKEALDAIDSAFYGINEVTTDPDKDFVYANPIVNSRGNEKAYIDIKMETGTGKTYVGVRTMYELHKKYGLFKFIVVVPSPAIKEGWKNFIQADYARQHFSQFYENTSINLSVINAGDFNSKKGLLPAHLVEFIEGDRINSNIIHVLLINSSMLNSDNMKGIYSSGKNAGKDRFNQTLLSGFTRPLDAIQATRPIVMIDEPHRFPREGKYYKSIENTLPQLIIRFGATFPDKKIGKGKNAKIIKDYYREQPQFNLNAVSAFNDGLVKGIDIYYPNVTEEEAKERYVVESVTNKELVLKHKDTKYVISKGDDLGFEGDITYEGAKTLSNGLELDKGMVFLPATMTNSYQEMIIRDAIEKHFEVEISNFMRETPYQPKVKTLSLFFIDSIKSYRDKDGWLKKIFEKLLKEKLHSLIREYCMKIKPREKEYLEFLQVTLSEIEENVHAGYFGEDRGTGDEAIQAEVDDILKNKEKLLSFKDENGKWQTRRFLFSKWTLREGWDNPNVFVIAKLRTSGSENSKIQEVGRGLRLPVDENGHRLLQDELSSRLSFFIGYDERDFAERLTSEVNSDVKMQLNHETLTNDMITSIISKYPDYNAESLLEYLDDMDIIKRNNDFKNSGFDKLLELFPAIQDDHVVRKDKITNGGPKSKQRVKLNKENWHKMTGLWQELSKRYMLVFDEMTEENISFLLEEVFNNLDNFSYYEMDIIKNEIQMDVESKKITVREEKTEQYATRRVKGMKYGKFISMIARQIKVSPSLIHQQLFGVLKNQLDGDCDYLNELTLSNVVRDFKERFERRYSQSYHYEALDFQASTSIFDVNQNEFKDDVLATLIGVNEDFGVNENDNRQLYEFPPIRYDSVSPERELLKYQYPKEVIAFGKLPKKAIQIPKYMGGSTTPDFVYLVEKEDGSHIYLLIETKAEGSGKRISDQQIIEIQHKFFDRLKSIGVEYQEASSLNDVRSRLRKVVDKNEK